MIRKAGILIAVLTALTLTVSSAFGVAAKFHASSGSVNGDGALVVTWDERGVGSGDIAYTLTADATALYACINGGGKNPSAANKQAFDGSVSAAGSFASKNGRVQGTLISGPLQAPSFTCPNGQRRVLAAVSYTNIVLTDTTNGSSVDIADTSRVFFAV